jgi:hypothetical protein
VRPIDILVTVLVVLVELFVIALMIAPNAVLRRLRRRGAS